MTEEPGIELESMLCDVRRCWDVSLTPREKREAYNAWVAENKPHTDRLFALIAATAAWWIIRGKDAGHDQDILEQCALQTTQQAIAVIAKTMKKRQGEPFEPARVAIVGYAIAQVVADTQIEADLEGVTRAAEGLADRAEKENKELRDLIEGIISGEVAPRDVPNFYEAIIAPEKSGEDDRE